MREEERFTENSGVRSTQYLHFLSILGQLLNIIDYEHVIVIGVLNIFFRLF